MTNVISVSISPQQFEYIKARKLSPSLIFQTQLDTLMGLAPGFAASELQESREKVANLAKRLSKICAFLEKRGVINEFLEEERQSGDEER